MSPVPTPPPSEPAPSLHPVEELQALCDTATAGPWQAYFTIHGDPYVVPADRPWPSSQIAEISTAARDYGRADAQFIAAARTALPSLLARLRAAEETLAAVGALAEEWRYKGEHGWGPWQLGEGPDQEGFLLDECAALLRAALAEGASR